MDKLAQVTGILHALRSIVAQANYTDVYKGMEAQCIETYRKCVDLLMTVEGYEEIDTIAPELKDSATMKEIGFAVEMLLSIVKSGQGQPVSPRISLHLPHLSRTLKISRPPRPPRPPRPRPGRRRSVGVTITATGTGAGTVTRSATSWREMDEKIDQEQERFEEQVEAIQDNIDELQDKIDELQDKIDELRDELEDRIEEIREEYEAKIEELDEAEEDDEDEEHENDGPEIEGDLGGASNIEDIPDEPNN